MSEQKRQLPQLQKVLIDIPFVNNTIQMRVRVPVAVNATNLKSKDYRLIQFGSQSNGENYLKISPQPSFYLNVRDGNGEFNAGCGIYMNPFQLMRFTNALAEILRRFEIKNLFFYNNGELVLNKDIPKEILELRLPVYQQFISLSFCVINGNDPTQRKESNAMMTQYEGIRLSMNNGISNTFLTVEEVKLLFNTIRKIDMFQLSMQATNMIWNMELSR